MRQDSNIADRRGKGRDPLPPLLFEVRMPAGRKRGGQPGNRNRLRHGRFSQTFAERRAEIRAMIADAENLIVRAKMVGRARRNYLAVSKRLSGLANPASAPARPQTPRLTQRR